MNLLILRHASSLLLQRGTPLVCLVDLLAIRSLQGDGVVGVEALGVDLGGRPDTPSLLGGGVGLVALVLGQTVRYNVDSVPL